MDEFDLNKKRVIHILDIIHGNLTFHESDLLDQFVMEDQLLSKLRNINNSIRVLRNTKCDNLDFVIQVENRLEQLTHNAADISIECYARLAEFLKEHNGYLGV